MNVKKRLSLSCFEMGAYKTVNKNSVCEMFFVAKAEKGERGGKGIDSKKEIWYNIEAVGKTAPQKASETRG